MRIGHASIDEHGKARGGEAGDQNGKEVKISNYYSGGWKYILRPKDIILAEKVARACEQGCNNPNIGYDQNQRNTLHTVAKSFGYDLEMVCMLCETDCSAFMTVCALAGGVKELEYEGNAPTTTTMTQVFKATKKFYVIDEPKIISEKYLRRGDILVKPGSHTVMVLDNGSLYNYVLFGNKGQDVFSVQKRLASAGYPVGEIDGDCGSRTVSCIKQFQRDNNLEVDGIFGKECYKKLQR